MEERAEGGEEADGIFAAEAGGFEDYAREGRKRVFFGYVDARGSEDAGSGTAVAGG